MCLFTIRLTNGCGFCRKRYTVHTIKLLHKSIEVSLDNVDEDCYSFMDLFDDAMESLGIEAGSVLSFQDRKGYFIENDKDILSMFERFSLELVIPISVAVLGCPTAVLPPVVVVELDDDDDMEEAQPAQNDPQIEPEPIPQTEPQPELEPIPEPELEAEPEAMAQSEPEAMTQAESEPIPEPELEAEPEAMAQPESEPIPEPELEAQPEAMAQPEPEAITQPESEPIPIPEPQNESETGTQSQRKRKKGADKRMEMGRKSNRYSFRKNRKVPNDDFIVSDEDFGHSEDEDFDINVDVGFSESENEAENGSENESEHGSNDSVRDELLSECPDDSSQDDSEEEDTTGANPLKGIKGKLFNGVVDNNFEFECGQLFRDVKHIREVLLDYEVLGGYGISRLKNDKLRLTAICANPECKWRLHASVLPDKRTFMVKKPVQNHVCIRDPEKSIVTPKWIAKQMQEDLRAEPNMSYRSMEDNLRRKFGVECKQGTIYKAKRRARLQNEGNLIESFAKLHAYAEVLRRIDPGTVVKFSYQDRQNMDAQPVFKRMFVAFAATIHGFLNGCRPFFGVDGTFLKGSFEGMLLTAVSVDGNKGTYPFAFCIVEGECTDSWVWFFDCLKDYIGENNRGVPYTIMSDKQKVSKFTSIIKTMLLMPYYQNRLCNFKQCCLCHIIKIDYAISNNVAYAILSKQTMIL